MRYWSGKSKSTSQLRFRKSSSVWISHCSRWPISYKCMEASLSGFSMDVGAQAVVAVDVEIVSIGLVVKRQGVELAAERFVLAHLIPLAPRCVH